MDFVFPTRFTPSLKISSCTGNFIKPVYKSRFNKVGTVVVEKKSEINVYKQIQSFADSVDINKLIARYQAGETDILDRRKAQYLDLTEMPESYFDAVNQINDLKDSFNKLSSEIKKKFDFSADKYVAAICTGDLEKLLFSKELEKEVEKKIDTLEEKEKVSEKIEKFKDSEVKE